MGVVCRCVHVRVCMYTHTHIQYVYKHEHNYTGSTKLHLRQHIACHLDSQWGVGIIQVATDASKPEVHTISEVLSGIHLEHLTHVYQLCLALLR